MKRPILIALIGYIIGIIWELYLKISIAPIIIILTIIYIVYNYRKYICKNCKLYKYIESIYIKILSNIKFQYHSKINTNAIIILILSITISNFIIIHLNKKYKKVYNTSTEEQMYIGTIISDQSKEEYKSVYTIKIETMSKDTKIKNIKLKLNIPNMYDIKLKYGDKIKIKGTYTAPDVQRNYKGFDYSKYLKTLNIFGTISYSGSYIKILEKENINYIKLITHKIRYNMEENIKNLFPKKEAGLLIGILLGNNENIDEDIKEEFRNSGIYHILAVSGAHMSYIILGTTYLLEKINISKRKKEIFKILGIIFFMLITNSSISVARAGIMAIITLVANLFYRKKDIVNTISFSMLIILIYNPYSIDSISFQLSYGGVIGIILLNNHYKKLLKKIKLNKKVSESISVILSAQTMIIPIMIINFHTISFTFLFANILVNYIIGIIIILGFICAFLSLVSLEISRFMTTFVDFPLKILIFIAKVFGKFPLSNIYIINPNALSIFLYYTMIYSLTLKSRGRVVNSSKDKITKTLAILLIITVVFNNYIYNPGKLSIYFIDVGQGDSCMVITPNNKKILIDGGGTINTTGNYNVGEQILIPYLLNRGIKSLDYIIISHFDADHVRTEC